MPRTNMGKLKNPVMTPAEKNAHVIRMAFATRGIFKQQEMAEFAGIHVCTFSKGMHNGFSSSLLARIHGALKFTPEELGELVWK